MPEPRTNLRVLKPARRKPRSGDIFAMALLDGTHIFGRVIDADIGDPHLAPMPGSYLIYVYRHRSESRDADLTQLTPSNLLLPPIFINKMPWTKGYFETVDHVELTQRDLLPQVSFWDSARSNFVDRERRVIGREVQPCGNWALMSYRWLDDQISDALGIPRVPEDD